MKYQDAIAKAKDDLRQLFAWMDDAALTRAAEGRVRMLYPGLGPETAPASSPNTLAEAK